MAKKVFQSMDGNQAAAYASYGFTEVAGIYPITPSSPMAEYVDEWASKGKKNFFGMPVKLVEMQSEGGAAGTVHGSLQAGALTTTYTASQGLLLKIPNMYKIAGELLPGVIHVSARSLAVQALSIFGDHQDVMAARQTGWAMMATSSVQEVMDLAGVAHLTAIKSSIPVLHFFDGFRTSHEIQKIEVLDEEVLKGLLDTDSVDKFRGRALSPNRPVTRGSAQNDDVYFQTREAQNKYYTNIPDTVQAYFDEISKATGRDYKLFNYFGAEDATDVIIAMGSVNETAKEVVEKLVADGKKVGLINVHLYRPFSLEHFMASMPSSVKRIAVLDRTKEQGSIGEPLYLDIKAAYYGRDNAPIVIGGRYGLSSKDVDPGQIFAVFENLEKGNDAINSFTVGITDDVTHLSLPVTNKTQVTGDGVSELIFYGLGSDGTVGANKNTVKIIGDNTDYYAQAYFAYDSKKSGGVTRSHLRFSRKPIRSTYLVKNAGFISCSLDSYVEKYDMLADLKDNGRFLLNTTKSDEELINMMPNSFKKQLADKNTRVYLINAVDLAHEIGLGNRTNTIMQSAFFKLNPQIMNFDEAKRLMKESANKSYSKRGQAIVELNYKAIDLGEEGIREFKVDPTWSALPEDAASTLKKQPDFVANIANPVNAIKGDDLPVSAFNGYEDGTMENGTTKHEKRYIAQFVPEWIEENCIQCNQCSFVCPHAVIRPYLSTEEEVSQAPSGTQYLKPMGKAFEGLQYSIIVSIPDCTGCESCVNSCPGKKGQKALKMVPIDKAISEGRAEVALYFHENVTYKDTLVDKFVNPKNSQFAQPLFEFSGACAGCGETPYIKLVTQLYGDHMLIANATGCSSIYGGSFPATPYSKNSEGKGPAWANSLFEDNAEFGYGMRMATEAIRSRIGVMMEDGINDPKVSGRVKELYHDWLNNRDSSVETKKIASELVPLLKNEKAETSKEIFKLEDYLIKRSQWIIGGDGWAYDIGFGGLDHVIANGEDVNILVLDTEVYSNTGGQSSKSSPTASIAKFTAGGKSGKKKDLAAIAMSYGHVYVASIAHGASQSQMLKAIREAESYNGPSILIAYSPCISHGIKAGMGKSQEQTKLAVECGYWSTFRFDPRLEDEGKNPFQMDSKTPNWDLYETYLESETRYSQLKRANPEEAEALLASNKKEAQRRYRTYERLSVMDYSI